MSFAIKVLRVELRLSPKLSVRNAPLLNFVKCTFVEENFYRDPVNRV